MGLERSHLSGQNRSGSGKYFSSRPITYVDNKISWPETIKLSSFPFIPALPRCRLACKILTLKVIFCAAKSCSRTVFLYLLGFKSRSRTILWVKVPVNQELFIFCPKYECFFYSKYRCNKWIVLAWLQRIYFWAKITNLNLIKVKISKIVRFKK